MIRDEAYKILTELIKNQNLIKHHLACEAAMRALHRRFKESRESKDSRDSEEKWAIVGLLHDADYELTKDAPARHTLVLEEKIGDKLDPAVLYAIKAHNWQHTGVEPKSPIDWSIYCCDELTGLIVAAALVHPKKELAVLTPEFILNRFQEKAFARGANREQIAACEEKLGISLKDFIDLVLGAMQGISSELGL